jgi:hypothetical protein
MRHHSDSLKISKMNEKTSHYRHRLSHYSNKYGSRSLIGQPTYRPCIKNSDFGGRTQKKYGRRDVDVSKISTFNPCQEKTNNNNRINNDRCHNENYVASTYILSYHTQRLRINH